ncbi:MAG: polysaccharide pyruvyl transferase family protein [Pseudomonadales bacterium]|nr:polysaccharide pyruvyl transferase family protein [Pseudomonadales bacterium]
MINRTVRKPDIFLPLIGQYHNIGDIILRRPLAKWVEGEGNLHIFTGNAPDSYTEGLQLHSDAKVYCSFSNWMFSGFVSSSMAKTAYLFKPGEIQLSFSGMKEHVGVLPLVLWLKIFGGKAARIGSGSRNFSEFYRRLMLPSLLAASLSYWRDPKTSAFLGIGSTMPDLAFWEGASLADVSDDSLRDTLVVSMRGDRPLPGAAWVEAIKSFAKAHGLKIVVVTQVTIDAKATEQLARLFDCEQLNWDGTDHYKQEVALRNLYRRSVVTVSDRLHVLIAAFTEGAMPAGLITDRSDKVERHFSAIKMSNISQSSVDTPDSQIPKFIDGVISQRDRYIQCLADARADLDCIRKHTIKLINSL